MGLQTQCQQGFKQLYTNHKGFSLLARTRRP
jgi:hypothetical protein